MNISPQAIYERINTKIVGQYEAKKVISNVMYRHFIRTYARNLYKESLPTATFLLAGSSGMGKTALIRAASKALQEVTRSRMAPVLEVDCTALTPKGWIGDNMDELIRDHREYLGEGKDVEFNTTILYLDEFDKLMIPAVGSGGTDHSKQTQYSLLKLFEGCPINVSSNKSPSVQIQTSGFLIVVSGAFSNIKHNIEARGKTIGFIKSKEESSYKHFHKELEASGLSTQLAGRISDIGILTDLTKDEMYTILVTHILPEYDSIFKYTTATPNISQRKLKQIVEEALELKMGARGLRIIADKVFTDELFNSEFKDEVPNVLQ